MRLPLLAWQLHAAALPERLCPVLKRDAFSLPGIDALDDYADLLGGTAASEQPVSDAPTALFFLPGELPSDIPGPVTLTHEIDFRAFSGDCAHLTFGLLTGRGEVMLDDQRLARFENEPLDLDVTAALRRMRRQTLALRFERDRPAGSPCAVTLRIARFARLVRVNPVPDAKTLTLFARIKSFHAGEYVLRALILSKQGTPVLAQEISLFLGEGDLHDVEWTLQGAMSDMPGVHFVPGSTSESPVLRMQLFLKAKACAAVPGALCDEETLMFTAPTSSALAPRFWLPLSMEDCLRPPQDLAERLSALRIPCVSLPEGAPEALFPSLARAGIALRVSSDRATRLARFPCFAADTQEQALPLSQAAALAAWQLCSMPVCPRTPDLALPAATLLSEAAGRPLDPDDPQVAEVLSWLHAVFIRLRAEALRQGLCSGSLCPLNAWAQEDVADALRTALAPVHLSALPLFGAWWTGVHFSASLYAFVPEGEDELAASASLEDEHGRRLAHETYPCPSGGGRLGLIEATLPDFPCVLTLHTELTRKDAVIEESVIPVYVGRRGPLEAAFAPLPDS